MKESKGRKKEIVSLQYPLILTKAFPNDLNRDFMRRIWPCEFKEVLRRMKTRKAVGSNAIPIEVWKCLGEFGVTG